MLLEELFRGNLSPVDLVYPADPEYKQLSKEALTSVSSSSMSSPLPKRSYWTSSPIPSIPPSSSNVSPISPSASPPASSCSEKSRNISIALLNNSTPRHECREHENSSCTDTSIQELLFFSSYTNSPLNIMISLKLIEF